MHTHLLDEEVLEVEALLGEGVVRQAHLRHLVAGGGQCADITRGDRTSHELAARLLLLHALLQRDGLLEQVVVDEVVLGRLSQELFQRRLVTGLSPQNNVAHAPITHEDREPSTAVAAHATITCRAH